MDYVQYILNSSDNIALLGPGGTGKSYLIKELMKENNGNMLCTASTGIAAIPINGVTLHRALGMGLFKGKVPSLHKQMEGKPALVKKWRTIDTLIIDEISMLDISVFVRASQLMSLIRDDKRPWGGIRLVLSGDFLQLPPVETYREGGKTYTYLFEHPIWKKMDLKPIILNTPYRFVSNEFFEILGDIRYGVLSDRVKDMVKSCIRKIEKHPTGIVPTIVMSINNDVDEFNREKLARLPGEEHSYSAIWSSTFRGEPIPMKKAMKDNILKSTRIQDNLVLKRGAQVMLMVNTVNDSLCNGSRGVVIGFGDGDLPLVRFLNGMELLIKPNTWPSFGSPREVDGELEWENHKVTQIPLRLAYAATAHKTQGMTLDTAVLCVDRCFASNHIYVMLSRCRDPKHMYIIGWDEDKFRECAPDPSVVEFYKAIESESEV